MKPVHRLIQNKNQSGSWKLDYAYLLIPIFQDLARISTHVMRKTKMWDPPVPVVMPFGTTRLYYVDMLLCWTLLGFQIGCPTKYYSRGCNNTANCFCYSAYHSTTTGSQCSDAILSWLEISGTWNKSNVTSHIATICTDWLRVCTFLWWNSS